ncbi:unnamed protein product [Arabidopsis halleri]
MCLCSLVRHFERNVSCFKDTINYNIIFFNFVFFLLGEDTQKCLCDGDGLRGQK